MDRGFLGTALVLIAGLYSSVASAGIYTDDLSKCLVKSANPDDQILLVQWMFSAFSLHPAVEPLVTLSPQQRDLLNRKSAELLQRLLLEDCRNETVAALKYEGPGAMEAGFKTLGEVAGRGLMTDPRVAQALQGLASYLDRDKLNELARAAGLLQQTAPAGAPAK
jgi:hypothetical protein